ncbi:MULTISPECIES: PRC-barrel domain-containing protein [Streptomyces]|uniref:PRC-barrel domain-containing protein n=1 Tax=Streptomyces TaxID=1883 RepID=UPI00167565A5|nr:MULTISPECIES: PRC-barrel domain-containing protein [Streptomyces]MBK3526284.1 PRC-barrel domain-containing protein [Streptomyces sp. MBT70]GGR56860.1 photosystem reaction center subunit H [Streptomyces eurythermus]
MIPLVLASELTKRVVVTLGGEAVAQIRDTVFDARAGRVTGFTLSGRGLLAGPLKESLPFSGVHAVGPSAVMIPSEASLERRELTVGADGSGHGQVIGAPVLTDQGTEIGTVLDVVIETGVGGRVVGFEIAADETMDRHRRKAFIPRGETLAVSGRALVVPAHARHFLADDLPSFGAQVEAFRAHTAQQYPGSPATEAGGPA